MPMVRIGDRSGLPYSRWTTEEVPALWQQSSGEGPGPLLGAPGRESKSAAPNQEGFLLTHVTCHPCHAKILQLGSGWDPSAQWQVGGGSVPGAGSDQHAPVPVDLPKFVKDPWSSKLCIQTIIH